MKAGVLASLNEEEIFFDLVVDWRTHRRGDDRRNRRRQTRRDHRRAHRRTTGGRTNRTRTREIERIPSGLDVDNGLAALGALAADTVARAVARGVYEATALPFSGAPPAWKDKFGGKTGKN